MTHAELWLTYQLASRAHLKVPPTTQLIELEFQNHKLSDLEDVLDHVFRQGFVEARHRPSTWWERKDGQKVKPGFSVEELLKQGVGKCPESALKLVVADIPTTLWFTYVHLHNATAHPVTQRVQLVGPPSNPGRLERFANVTNYIFNQGYIAPKMRPFVHWEQPCGKMIDEFMRVEELLLTGLGVCEDKPLRLVIDAHPVHVHPDHHHDHSVHHDHSIHHDHTTHHGHTIPHGHCPVTMPTPKPSCGCGHY
ncbi:hypothetical protein BDZ94DRAFT_1281490 [Collybia nuda]|uniref:Uncharacterized protein n=1 Tax=Collybia nuda TaxID=64659 RepID=A0A9P6CGN3_9AGAR|nr:hypothetical protein BDZ94DRAFT_1281490 [Collybia nuda]